MRKLTPLIAALLLSACAVGPNYEKPQFAMPDLWPWNDPQKAADRASGEAMDTVTRDWWNQFNDPALSAMVTEGLANNADLLIAASRVSQARAALGLSEANLYPEISVQGNATRTSNSDEARFGGFTANSKPFNDFGISAVLDYELDLWGRLRRARESDRAQLLSVQANRDAVDLAVASDIATGYFNLRSLDAQIKVTKETIESRSESLRYQKTQYNVGSVNGLTFRQAEAELAAAEGQLPMLEQARLEQNNALSILLGRSPKEITEGTIAAGKTVDELPTTPIIPVELPSTLLERRPEVVSAEQALVAANADIGEAKADYFPRVSLSGLIGLGAADGDRVLRSSARKWNAGANIAGPLVDFGRRKSIVRGAEARKEEALLTYEQSVRLAFRDVLNALSAENTSALRETAQQKQITSRSEALKLAEVRYKSGYSNYLEVLDAQRFLYQAQLERIIARRDRLTAAVNVYKSLGGGWSQNGSAPKAAVIEKKITPAPAAIEPAQPPEVVKEPVKKPVAKKPAPKAELPLIQSNFTQNTTSDEMLAE